MSTRVIVLIRYDSKNITTVCNGKKRVYPVKLFRRGVVPENTKVVVCSRSTSKAAKSRKAHWAEVDLPKYDVNSPPSKIICTNPDIIGVAYQIESEVMAILRHYRACPRKYPKDLSLTNKPLPNVVDLTHLPTICIDGESTLDRDDAVSAWINPENQKLEVYVHITNVGGQISPTSELAKFALNHHASVYPGNIGFDSKLVSSEYPLLPKALAHDKFSLNQGEVRQVISYQVTMEIDNPTTKKASWCLAKIKNKCSYTYQKFDQIPSCELPIKSLLQKYTQETSSTKIIESLMIEYNQYFGKLVPIVRIQKGTSSAEYVQVTSAEEKYPHQALGINRYMHASSPIRRAPDLLVQWMLLYGEDIIPTIDKYLKHANDRSTELKRCHQNIDLVKLVHLFKKEPKQVKIKILEVRQDSFLAELQSESISEINSNLRVWFPKTDNLVANLEIDTNLINSSKILKVELWGIHDSYPKGIPKLRIKSIG